MLQQILRIICGEAKPESKFEVIRDMFLEQVKERENIGEGEIRNRTYPDRHFLTERINERDSGRYF